MGERTLNRGAIEFADKELQALFDASRLALLELNDNDFISPGPFLYHHFWYRDATLMIRALDVLGFHKRSRQVIDAFPARLTPDGFFRGPDGSGIPTVPFSGRFINTFCSTDNTSG